MSDTVLSLMHIHHHYTQAGQRLNVLEDVTLQLEAGQVVGLIGASGTGKSTLLHIAGLLDAPLKGHITIMGRDCTALSVTQQAQVRNTHIGFIYQFHHLLRDFTAVENVMLPQLIAGVDKKIASERSLILLSQFNLENRAHHRPSQLSGGEQQRVAIARALANRPKLLLADEPTGNLDPETSAIVFAELLSQAREHGVAALIATHNHALAAQMDKTYSLSKGVLRRE